MKIDKKKENDEQNREIEFSSGIFENHLMENVEIND